MNEQSCYFNIEDNDKLFSSLLSKAIRNNTSSKDLIHFQIEHVLGENKIKEMYSATAE